MKCPQCQSSNLRNGYQNRKQRFECKDCDRLFRDSYEARGYHLQVKKNCLEMYLNGMEFRAIERVTCIHHASIMNWVKESAEELPEDEEDHPIVAELDELQTFIGRKALLNEQWIS
ncbi:MAG: IS1 family transposase [Chroococcidiopsidaceae cyanobacterium CP_BM_RX_35]|nr:IS1 family transposase [Chroococcidiopsidaceae cyanobacterium CP_BM_RX_35]